MDKPSSKREFLDRLQRCLAELGEAERASMVEFYDEQISDRTDDGMTEEQACASLECPEDIAATILAQRAEQRAASAPAPASRPAASGQPAPAKGHPVLRGIGKACLGFLEVLLAIFLIPVAVGAVATLASCYVALWVAALALVVGGVGSAIGCVVLVCTLFVAPPATGAVAVATAGLIVAALGLTVLLVIAGYAFGKLLVYVWVWVARAWKRRRARKAAASKNYPSMPMPPSVQQKSRRMPLWAKFAIVSGTLTLIGGGMVLGAMGAASGPTGLVRQASQNSAVTELVLDADDVTRIDISSPLAQVGSTQLAWVGMGGDYADTQYQAFLAVAIGASPDDKVHVVGTDFSAGSVISMVESGTLVQPVQDGTTVRLEAQAAPSGLAVNNPFAAFGRDVAVHVLLPAGWSGEVVCDSAVTVVHRDYSSLYGAGDAQLDVRADFDLSAAVVALSRLSTTGTLAIEAGDIWLVDLSVTELQVHGVRGDGIPGLDDGDVMLDNVSSKRGSVEADGTIRDGNGTTLPSEMTASDTE